ncbi:MAG TPA: hypothetical protein VJL29_13345 [Thermoguttaceae bacterium]|nr:hypothetical protein [Thermoguttaceae bacterium]
MLNSLPPTLAGAGKSSETLAMQDGTRLLLLPYGARILGLFAAEDEQNFFWTNPLLDNGETARELFASDGWHNTGGDRTWIAPELDTFYTDATFAQYWQPRPLDMSDYVMERVGGGCRLSREMTLHLARSNRDVGLRLTKWFGPAASPLRDEPGLASVARGVEYAGYTQRATLESLAPDGAEPPAVGLWNLLQLPAGGEMLVPLYARCAPQKCFGDVPRESMILEERLLRIKVDFPGSHKIAVKAAVLCGRAGYIYGENDRWSLVIRNFSVNPSGAYVDVQRPDLEDFGYAFQMCRVDEPEFGSFCELEYHAPALGELPDPSRSEDVSQVWAFRGERKAIDAIARVLLGVER